MQLRLAEAGWVEDVKPAAHEMHVLAHQVDLQPILGVPSGAVPVKVTHNARFERRVLSAIGVRLDGVFDTLEASLRARGIDALGGNSLAMACERELGIVLDKSSQTSNWSRRPLHGDQSRYAALDAEVLLALRERFHEPGHHSRGRGHSSPGIGASSGHFRCMPCRTICCRSALHSVEPGRRLDRGSRPAAVDQGSSSRPDEPVESLRGV